MVLRDNKNTIFQMVLFIKTFHTSSRVHVVERSPKQGYGGDKHQRKVVKEDVLFYWDDRVLNQCANRQQQFVKRCLSQADFDGLTDWLTCVGLCSGSMDALADCDTPPGTVVAQRH